MVTILSKTADTNHFIRDDAMKTLEAMIENVPPQKALAVLITNGTGYDHGFYLLALDFISVGGVSMLWLKSSGVL